MKRFLVSLVYMLTFMAAAAWCQELTLQDCLDRALDANSGLKSHAMELSAAEEGRYMAETSFYPAFKVRGSYSLFDEPDRFIVERDAFGAGIPSQDTELTSGDSSTYNITAIVTQPLFTGGNLTHSYRRALAVRDEAALGYQRWRKDLVRQVKTAFFEALNSQFHTDSMRRVATARRERLRVFIERMEEGFVLKEDLMRLEGDILLAELEITRGENKTGRALRKLKNLMEYKGEAEPVLKGVPQKGRIIASLAEVQEVAALYREELTMVRKRAEAAQEDVLVARSALYPQLSLEGRYTHQKETNADRSESWMLTAQADWTIFEWGRTRSDIAQKTALRQRADYLSTEQAKQVMLEVEDAWRGVREAEQLTVAREHQLKTAEYVLQRARERYSEGTSMLTDVVDREAEFLAASNDYSAAINDVTTSLANLEAATGASLERWVLQDERYRPDFDGHAKKMQELLQQRGRERGEIAGQTAAPEPKKPIEADNAADEAMPSEVNVPAAVIVTPAESSSVPQAAPVVNSPRVTMRSSDGMRDPYEVQLASFKNRKNAETYRKAMLKKYSKWPVKVVAVGDAFKVRLPGFPDRETAEKTMKDSGIGNYLVVRVASGHR